MDGPTYISLSAQIALKRALDVTANNVANANTTGFRADKTHFQSFNQRLASSGSVAYVQDRATYIDQTAGSISSTGNPLDVAIDGPGLLTVQTPAGPKYTRDGRMKLSNERTFVDSSGRPYLGADGGQLQLPEGAEQIEIKGDGTITALVDQRSQEIGRLGVVIPTNVNALRKGGDGLIEAPRGTIRPAAEGEAGSRLIQGALEGSSVSAIREITNLTEIQRSYERLQRLVQDDNERERKLIETLTRSN